MSKRISTALQIAVCLMAFALIGGIISVFLCFTDGGTTEFATFYVECDGKDLLSDQTVALKEGKTVTFSPKYTVDTIGDMLGKTDETDESTQSQKGHTVEIVPNITDETGFEYTVGENSEEEYYRFAKLANKDFCSAFGYKKGATSFSLHVDEFSVANFLSTKHDGKKVTLPSTFDERQTYFNLIVTSYDGKNVLKFGLTEDLIIDFTIDGKAYKAEKEMTLSEWSESELCTADIDVSGKISIAGEKYRLFDKAAEGFVVENDTQLTDGGAYFAVHYCFTFRIDEVNYLAGQNMTWADWIASNYCTLSKCEIGTDGSVYVVKAGETEKKRIVKSNGQAVKAADYVCEADGTIFEVQKNETNT